ncbi:NADH dehydrogenase [Vulcanimicrobium alpinum]|uniref:NADH dehydrogenase n=1 Tax=Vulcanimicrobium alpinum TaxID=3016050 RepID=A0AAN1Y0A2_UNVUL|nr:proton-conducting transporter membrane subunit [Vulcanimicrobium alpinum]BDE08241.1 NADH dehydrogenase [Vulcanimicrobium alpinum]
MNPIVAAIVAIPGMLAIVCLLLPYTVGRALTAVGAVVTAMLIAIVAVMVSQHRGTIDAQSTLFLLPLGIVYACVGIYTVWYVEAEAHGSDRERFRREFLALTNAFAFVEVIVPLVTNMAGLWVAMEATTIVAALLVRLQGTPAALEAAWKYILIASCGLGLALVAVIVLYAGGTEALGTRYSPDWAAYVSAARRLNPDAVRLAFLFALVGFGTKMGLAPMHTWLPDAHGAGPTPTSAMLSGVVLSDALYAILRFAAITNAALGPSYARHLFAVLGLLSLFLAAFFLLQQRDLKRMFAYSSIEHMGIVATALSFSAPIAVAGAMLHVVNHAATKSLAFLAAGRIAERYETREIAGIRGALVTLPVSSAFLAIAGLALAGMPPFGMFRSELMILVGGFSSAPLRAGALLVLLVIAFAGIVRWIAAVTGGAPPESIVRGERAIFPIIGMALGVVIVVGLGVYVPNVLKVLIFGVQHILAGNVS